MAFRLGLEVTREDQCPHVNQAGSRCSEVCDPHGYHLLACPSGGGFLVSHDSVAAEFCHLACETTGTRMSWKPRVEEWPRQVRGAEADFGFSNLPGMRDTYFDVVLSLANPSTYPGAERTPGHVAELKARTKKRDHPVHGAQRRRVVPFDFVPLSFERHGRWGRDAVRFTRVLAGKQAVLLGLEPSAEIARWYAVIACTIQRATAHVLRGDPVPLSTHRADQRASVSLWDLRLVA